MAQVNLKWCCKSFELFKFYFSKIIIIVVAQEHPTFHQRQFVQHVPFTNMAIALMNVVQPIICVSGFFIRKELKLKYVLKKNLIVNFQYRHL